MTSKFSPYRLCNLPRCRITLLAFAYFLARSTWLCKVRCFSALRLMVDIPCPFRRPVIGGGVRRAGRTFPLSGATLAPRLVAVNHPMNGFPRCFAPWKVAPPSVVASARAL